MLSGKTSRRHAIAVAAVVLAVLLVAAAIFERTRTRVVVAEVPFSDLLRDLDRGIVSEVVVSGDTLDVKLTERTLVRTVRRRTT